MLILVARGELEAHELVHARQMARYTWAGFFVLYLLSGRCRVRLEAEAVVETEPGEWTEQRIESAARALTGPVYFPGLSGWQNPGERYARRVIHRRVGD